MSGATPLRIGIIGYGKMGGFLANNLKNAGAEITAAFRTDPEKFPATLDTTFPGIKRSATPDEILGDSTVNAVVIASPNTTHYDLCKRALIAGKHVLVEKPFTETIAQAKELTKLAADKNLTLMIDHTLLFTPEMRWITDQQENGIFRGRSIESIDAKRLEKFNPALAHLDLAPENGVHALYLIDTLMHSNTVTVSADPTDPCQEAKIHLRFDDNSTAEVDLERKTDRQPQRSTTITFAPAEGSTGEKVYWDETKTPRLEIEKDGTRSSPNSIQPDNNPLGGVARHFLNCIKTKKQPMCGGTQGIRMAQLLEAIEQSRNKKGAAITVSLTPYPKQGRSKS